MTTSTEIEEERHKHEEFDEYATLLVRKISKPLAHFLMKYTSVTPNQVTLLSIFPGVCGIFFLARGGYTNTLIGAIAAFLYLLLDAADGPIAREKKLSSDLGAWFDGIVGFFLLPLLMLAVAVGLQNYLALLVGAIAVLSFPLQFLIIHFFRSEIMGKAERLSGEIPPKFQWTRKIYGAILFYPVLLLGAIFAKTVLLFFAVCGTMVWVVTIFLQYRILKKNALMGEL